MTDKNDRSNTAMVSASITDLFPEKHVTFHTVEKALGDNLPILDNVTITGSVPEPGSLLLTSLGAACGFLRSRSSRVQ